MKHSLMFTLFLSTFTFIAQAAQVCPVPITAVLTEQISPACPLDTGSIRVIIQGGTPPYTVVVATGGQIAQTQFGNSPFIFNGLAAGIYQVLVTDNTGCNSSTSVTVCGCPIVVNATTIPASCNGSDGQIIIQDIMQGVSPYLVTVSGNGQPSQTKPFVISPLIFPNLPAGTYTITVMDRIGCLSTPIQRTVEGSGSSLVVSFKTKRACPEKTGTISVTAITGGTAPYQVSVDGGPTQTFTGKKLTFSNLAAGKHTLTVTDASGCSTSITVVVCPCKVGSSKPSEEATKKIALAKASVLTHQKSNKLR